MARGPLHNLRALKVGNIADQFVDPEDIYSVLCDVNADRLITVSTITS